MAAAGRAANRTARRARPDRGPTAGTGTLTVTHGISPPADIGGPHGPAALRRLPRPASSHRRAPHPPDPARCRAGGAPRPAGVRRVLVRRAPLRRLGDDRL